MILYILLSFIFGFVIGRLSIRTRDIREYQKTNAMLAVTMNDLNNLIIKLQKEISNGEIISKQKVQDT